LLNKFILHNQNKTSNRFLDTTAGHRVKIYRRFWFV